MESVGTVIAFYCSMEIFWPWFAILDILSDGMATGRICRKLVIKLILSKFLKSLFISLMLCISSHMAIGTAPANASEPVNALVKGLDRQAGTIIIQPFGSTEQKRVSMDSLQESPEGSANITTGSRIRIWISTGKDGSFRADRILMLRRCDCTGTRRRLRMGIGRLGHDSSSMQPGMGCRCQWHMENRCEQ